jgi:hypothetical protein
MLAVHDHMRDFGRCDRLGHSDYGRTECAP